MTMQRLLQTASMLAIMGAGVPTHAHAQSEVEWTGQADQNPANGANWSGGVAPGQDATAVVARDGEPDEYPVIINGQAVQYRNLILGRGQDGNLTIMTGGQLQIGNDGNPGNVEVGLTTSPFGVINPSTGVLNVAGGLLDIRGRIGIGNGFRSEGRLDISGGGIARLQSFCIGCGNPNFAGRGSVVVAGEGSLFEVTSGTGERVIGNNGVDSGRADVTIRDGGRMVQTVASNTGWSLGRDSSLTVIGSGSTLDVPAPLASSGSLQVRQGASATLGSLAVAGGLLRVDAGSTLQQREGDVANWSFDQQAQIFVEGAGSQMIVNGALSIGSSRIGEGSGDFIIQDGASVISRSGNASALAFGERRNLIVRSGGRLELAGGLNIGTGTLTADNATVAIGGPLDMGGLFQGNIVNIFNSDFSASSIVAGANAAQGASIINFGGTAEGPAGAVGRFDVRQIRLGSVGNLSSEFVINHTNNDFEIATDIIGFGGIVRHLAGDTIFTGDQDNGSFSGQTLLTGGTLSVNGTHGNNAHVMTVSDGATLGGTGRINGVVTIQDATLAAGNSPGTLTFGGDLVLTADSILAFELGAPNGADSDRIDVLGNLTLDGTLDITDVSDFGAGLYRLFNYGGTLTDNGLEFGAVPMGFTAADLSVQTSVARQVNLLVAAPPIGGGLFSFWDGANTAPNAAVDGGAGVWSAASGNWTDAAGNANGAYDPDALLIFSGTGGLVTVDPSAGAVTVNTGMQFAVDGYRVAGGDIALGDNAIVLRVGDGTAAGAGITATIASNLIGGASIEKTDLGTLILTGNVAPTSGTTITSGALQIGDGGTTGTIAGDIVNNGRLIFNRDGESAYGGDISGTGSLIKRGAGTVTLSGEQTLAGPTSVEGGTLANTGTISSAVAVSAGANFINSGTAGEVSNGGSVTNSGVISSRVVNGTGATLTSTGTIDGQFLNFGTARLGGAMNGNVVNQATGVVTAIAPATFARLTQFAGGQFDVGSHAVTLNGLSGDGAILLGTGSLTVNVADQSLSSIFTGVMSGSGSLIKDGAGQLILRGSSSYTGGTTVRAGALSGDSASLRGAIAVAGGAGLLFNQDTDGVFDGLLSGEGRLTKAGSGRLVINGAHSISAITAAQGELQINGNLAQSIVQMNGGGSRLTGTGTIGGIRIVGGVSTIAPGAAPGAVGTLTVNGNVDLLPSSIYAVDVTAIAADRITASGTANLAGTLALSVTPGGYRLGTQYVLLSAAGGRTGEFNEVTGLSGFGPGLRPSIAYNANTVLLRLDPNAIGDVLGGAPLTFNQRSAVTRFDAAVTSGLADPNDFLAIYELPIANMPAAFDALSGEAYATVNRLVLDDERMVRQATLDHLGGAGKADGASVWMAGLGTFGTIKGDGNAARTTRDSAGFIAGLDFGGSFGSADSTWRIGLQGHYVRSSFAIADRASSGTIDRTGGGIYASGNFGDLGIRAGASLADVGIDVDRSIVAPGFAETAAASPQGTAFQAYGEVSYRLGTDRLRVEPFAGISHASFRIGAFSETGQAAAVSVAARKDRLTLLDVGLRGRLSLDADEPGEVELRSAIGVRRALGDRLLTADIGFASVPPVSFPVATIPQDRMTFTPEVGITAHLRKNVTLDASYTGVIGKHVSDHGLKAALRVAF